MIDLLVAPASADVAVQPALGVGVIAPWNEERAAGGPEPAPIEAVTATLDLYPTFVRTHARWRLRDPAGRPGALFAVPERSPQIGVVYPLRDVVVTVDGASVPATRRTSTICSDRASSSPPRLVREGPCLPHARTVLEALAAIGEANDWWTFRVDLPADRAVDVELRYAQDVAGDWYAHRVGYVVTAIAPPGPRLAADAPLYRVPTADVTWRLHDVDVRALRHLGPHPNATTGDTLTWHLRDVDATSGVIAMLDDDVDQALLPRDVTDAPYVFGEPEIVRMRDHLARFVLDRRPHDPEAWIVLVDALHEASRSDDAAVAAEARAALADLAARLDVPGPDGDRARAWLAADGAGGSVLATDAIAPYWADDAMPTLIDAAALAERRWWLTRVGTASAIAGGVALLLVASKGHRHERSRTGRNDSPRACTMTLP